MRALGRCTTVFADGDASGCQYDNQTVRVGAQLVWLCVGFEPHAVDGAIDGGARALAELDHVGTVAEQRADLHA